MPGPLLRFLQAARGAGLPVSVAEGLDAFAAHALVGYDDRQMLKDTLGLVLAKSEEDKARFEALFDLFFSREAFPASDARTEGGERPAGSENMPPSATAPGSESAGAASDLGRTIAEGDVNALAAQMELAAEEAGISSIRFFTQAGLYGRRILERMGLEGLEADIRRLGESGAEEAAARLLDGRRDLERAVRRFVEQQLALYAEGEAERLRDEYLQSVAITALDRRDLERMRRIVRALAKRLATRHMRHRRRHRRGHLDVRRMLRRSMAYDGILFQTHWKQKKIDRPKVVAICDVSGSVAQVAEFLLLFLYGLSEVLADTKTYVFCHSMAEVTEILARHDFAEAFAVIMRDFALGSSNYGTALEDFRRDGLDAIDSKTTVLILGDARGNNTEPRSDIVKEISLRAKRVIWLNPEYRGSWGSGDSDMPRYRPYCQLATVCNSVKHLEDVVGELLEP